MRVVFRKINSIQALKYCICIYLILLSGPVQALQLNDSMPGADSIPQTIKSKDYGYDISDFFKDMFKKLLQKLEADSSRNSSNNKVNTTILPAVGYALQTGFAASIGISVAFNTEQGEIAKHISSITSSLNYSQHKQFIFPLAANIWTPGNNYIFSIDSKFLKYPSKTYGLGARSLESNGYTMDFNLLKLHQTLLRKIVPGFYGGLGYYFDYVWNITEVDPPPGIITSFQQYGGQRKEIASGIALKLLFDNRLNQINPKEGAFASFILRPNFTFLGSNNNWTSLQLDFRKYIPIGGSKRKILALWSYNWLTLGSNKPPYLLLPSTGWDDQSNLGRGYIQGRYRAKEMIYAEVEYRFGISRNGFLGGVVFANAQSFSRTFSNQLSVITPAAGLGLRFNLNKYSDTNLSLDYGFGLNGSRGLFFNLGEVF